MGTSSEISGNSFWREGRLSFSLGYDQKGADSGFDAHDTASVTFDCEMGQEGRCTVEILGSVTLSDVVAIVTDHIETHFPKDEIAAAKSALQATPDVPIQRPEDRWQAAMQAASHP